ncbi:uncharacterized protein LOC141899713 isoform X2 [Tubulanus polymorphus]|uniref:uncharacterized protein LOC141899713 isoform X2 n=1 Tax=Tubulanus polymorphus TaxID=672921 RepID=UPI003DA4E60A
MILFQFVTSMSISFMSSFLPAYILYFGFKEEDKGYYVGILISAMYGGRIFASYFWGWLSDKVGRRPVILITLALQSLTTVTFGLCPNMVTAIVNRCLFGLSFGVIGPTKAVVLELSDNSNQGAYISMMVLGFGSGKMVGPTVSGFLAQPVEKYPNTFAAEGFFSQFPFILPCLPVFVLYIVAIIHAVMHLTETRQKNKSFEMENGRDLCEKCRILQSQLHINQYLRSCETLNMFYETYGKAPSAVTTNSWCRSAHNLDQAHKRHPAHSLQNDRKMSFSAPDLSFGVNGMGTPESVNLLMPSTGTTETRTCAVCLKDVKYKVQSGDCSDVSSDKNESGLKKFKNSAFYMIITRSEIRITVTLYTIMAATVTAIDEVFPIWASTATHLDGLGFDTNDIGSVLGIMSPPVLIIQLFLFALLERRIGARKTFLVSCVTVMIMTALLPITHLIEDQTVLLWVLLVSIVGVIKIASACCFSAASIFVNNCCSPAMAGAINGLSLMLSSCGRGLGPLFSGSMFAWSISSGVNLGYPFDVNFAFVMLSICFAICIFCDLFLPVSLDKQKKADTFS